MWFEVAMMGALVASLAAVGAGVALTGRRGGWRAGRARAFAATGPADPATQSDPSSPSGDTEGWIVPPGLDEKSRSALVACAFAAAPADHLCWTAMIIDPALHDTPSHIRLVGHYETELAAMDAAAQLADALNECLIPGEAPLTATAVGIEPHHAEPLSRTGSPIAYGGTPLAGYNALADLDGAVSYRG